MRISTKPIVVAAAGIASLALMVAAVPGTALACDNNSPTDLTCPGINLNPANPTSPLNPANQWANNPANPANPLNPYNAGYSDGYGYGSSGLGVLGILSGLVGPDQTAPAAAPVDAYAPEASPPVVHHHRHHRRHRHAE